MPGRSSFSVGLAAAIALSACTLVYGPSSEELSGGAKSDASSSASSSSGTLDGSPASSTSSSSGSSGSGPDAGGPFACPAAAIACEDFESGVPPFPKKEGTVEIVAGGHDSSKALEAVLIKNAPSPQIATVLTSESHTARVSFWFKPDGPPPHDSFTFRIASGLWGPACDWELTWQVYLKKDGLYTNTDAYDANVNPSCGPVEFKSAPLLTAAKVYDGKWHRITVTMDASKKARTTTTQVDDEPPLTSTVTSNKTSLPTEVDLAIGMPCIQEGGGCFGWEGETYRVRFDDFVVVLTP